uniref:Nuclear pore complex protein Nup85 n=1 Tax=Cacopsylla melanoneura TaxID=428564 RepID=A0A8D8RZ25_9HEMI
MSFTMDRSSSTRSKKVSTLLHPVTRTLVSESTNIFLSVQEINQLNSFELVQEILNSSKKYRCIIRECIQRLEISSQKNEDYVSSLCDVFSTTELCWHLCEILYFEPVSGDVILPLLKRWIQFHFMNYESVAVKILKYQDSEEASANVNTESLVPDYWSTVFGLLCQGNSRLAFKLVELHSKANTTAFSRAIKFLKYIPEFDELDAQSVREFEHSWQNWRSKVNADVEAGTFSGDNNLETAMKIVCGDPTVAKVIRKHCVSWYQYLIAKLLYTQPTIKSSQLEHYVADSMKVYKVSDKPELLSVVLKSLLQKDLHESIKGFMIMNDGCWCATHLTNLLQVGQFIPVNIHSNERLDKKLIIGYGRSLIESQVFWEIGVLYLRSCKQEGFDVLKTILSEIQMENDYVAKKVLQIANENHLFSVIQSVCTKRSEKYFELGRYVDALAWAIKGKNHDLASSLADIFLKQYVETDEMPLLEVVEHLGAKALFVDRLVFLTKFVQYCNKKNRKEFTEGLSMLIDLLVNNMVPNYFKLTYFMEISTLLSSILTEANKTDLVQILHSIEDYTNEFEAVPHNEDDKVSKQKYEELLRKINPLRKQVISQLALVSLPA